MLSESRKRSSLFLASVLVAARVLALLLGNPSAAAAAAAVVVLAVASADMTLTRAAWPPPATAAPPLLVGLQLLLGTLGSVTKGRLRGGAAAGYGVADVMERG